MIEDLHLIAQDCKKGCGQIKSVSNFAAEPTWDPISSAITFYNSSIYIGTANVSGLLINLRTLIPC